MRRFFAAALGLAAFSACFAAKYEVKFDPASQTAEISVSVPKLETLAFQMPAWIPGDYELFNYGQDVTSLEFRNGGTVVGSTKDGLNRWVASGPCDRVVYKVKTSMANFSPNLAYRNDVSYISGGAWGWIEGHDEEPTDVHFVMAAGDDAYSAMPYAEGKKDTFTATGYTQLIDSPTVVGRGIKVQDGPIRIVAIGQTDGADLKEFQDVGEQVALEAAQMLPGIEWKQYTFFLDFGGGGGGLEHTNSCRIGMWTKNPAQARGIMFHEFFHCYNVKRIKPEAIWKFDYSKAPKIDSLWWLEGVTDYFASVFQVRAGAMSQEDFLTNLGRNVTREKNRGVTNKISALESSQRVFETGGSQGYGGQSYYAKGLLAGAVLDLSIRGESGGKYSLDDVMAGLWLNYKSGKGYPESMIRELCVKFGGEATGKIYDLAITKAQPVPMDQVLAKAGFRMEGASIVKDTAAKGITVTIANNYPSSLLSK